MLILLLNKLYVCLRWDLLSSDSNNKIFILTDRVIKQKFEAYDDENYSHSKPSSLLSNKSFMPAVANQNLLTIFDTKSWYATGCRWTQKQFILQARTSQLRVFL